MLNYHLLFYLGSSPFHLYLNFNTSLSKFMNSLIYNRRDPHSRILKTQNIYINLLQLRILHHRSWSISLDLWHRWMQLSYHYLMLIKTEISIQNHPTWHGSLSVDYQVTRGRMVKNHYFGLILLIILDSNLL